MTAAKIAAALNVALKTDVGLMAAAEAGQTITVKGTCILKHIIKPLVKFFIKLLSMTTTTTTSYEVMRFPKIPTERNFGRIQRFFDLQMGFRISG